MFGDSPVVFLSAGVGGFLPAMKQIGNVAALPGIVHVSEKDSFKPFEVGTITRVLSVSTEVHWPP